MVAPTNRREVVKNSKATYTEALWFKLTYPLDLTKTRLQIQGEIATHDHHGGKIHAQHQYRGSIRTAVGIVREEGLRKLWQGVTPAVYRHIVYTGCRLVFYEKMRQLFGRNPDGTFPVWKAMTCGFCSGGAAQFFASPTDLIKVQMQMEGKRRLEGKPARVKNTADAFVKILRDGGVRGLWKGWVPNVQRAALVNLGELTTYDTAKHQILKHTSLEDNYVTHALASSCSGLVAASFGTPADVVKTRIMNQPIRNGRGLYYTSSWDCLVKTVQKEGFRALYKGFLPIWARMAPWSLTFWLTYEEIRHLFGSSSF